MWYRIKKKTIILKYYETIQSNIKVKFVFIYFGIHIEWFLIQQLKNKYKNINIYVYWCLKAFEDIHIPAGILIYIYLTLAVYNYANNKIHIKDKSNIKNNQTETNKLKQIKIVKSSTASVASPITTQRVCAVFRSNFNNHLKPLSVRPRLYMKCCNLKHLTI